MLDRDPRALRPVIGCFLVQHAVGHCDHAECGRRPGALGAGECSPGAAVRHIESDPDPDPEPEPELEPEPERIVLSSQRGTPGHAVAHWSSGPRTAVRPGSSSRVAAARHRQRERHPRVRVPPVPRATSSICRVHQQPVSGCSDPPGDTERVHRPFARTGARRIPGAPGREGHAGAGFRCHRWWFGVHVVLARGQHGHDHGAPRGGEHVVLPVRGPSGSRGVRRVPLCP